VGLVSALSSTAVAIDYSFAERLDHSTKATHVRLRGEIIRAEVGRMEAEVRQLEAEANRLRSELSALVDVPEDKVEDASNHVADGGSKPS
jgi:hypothetical protein